MNRKNELNLGDAIDKFLDDYRLRNKYDENYILSNWETLMGKTIARHTKSLRIKDKKIYISIEYAALRQELSFSKEKILSILNQNFKEPVIKEVIIC
ncbi:MAG: DUF721 domain-containing protein [Chitinophagales bacterium]|nr:DUF721 domain-containing protein [Chitinophagales bacterium]